ncbi:MAG: T9SS type A sorting domain-containing protein [Ignavibacteria bacterium]|jgi:hypothetical protein|nr:T9SS type A sorting domain-containing protein [Ignavibacteria bacterium]
MKKLLIIILFFCTASVLFSQTASTYFPANTGYKWYFKNIPLDSNNMPQPNLARYRIDSFAVVANYKGLLANIVRIKDNLTSFNQNMPYNDTSWYNFQTSNAWSYLSLAMLPDSIPVPGLMNFFRSLENWYNIYRFAQAVNSEYTVLTKDTTIAFDTLTVPIRVKIKAKRYNDQVVSTVNGNYTAKKFSTIFGLYYRILILEIPLIEIPDTTWFAENVWMVKQVNPSIRVNLTSLGFPVNFLFPGNMYELANPSIGINPVSSEVPEKFELGQNYPNPFNPSTTIEFAIPTADNVILELYDISGRKASELFSGRLNPGRYKYEFNAGTLSSGTYFYRLQAGKYAETRKMVVVK